MATAQSILDRHAADAPHASLADGFLAFERYTGREPLLLVAEAAASTTGQRFARGVYASVERFREAFVSTGRIDSFADLAALGPDDDDLAEAFGAQRKRHVLCSVADVLAARPETNDFAALTAWAASADIYQYETDPIGDISGVGPSSFQYLRILAGVDTARPTPAVTDLLESIGDELDAPHLGSEEPLRVIAACDWLGVETTFRRLEIDQLAWWVAADDEEREAVLERSNPPT